MAALTAALALFHDLELSTPFEGHSRPRNTPLIIYGASSAVGAFAVKLASFAKIHPIIAVGSRRSEFLREYLDDSKGDTMIDYTAQSTPDALAKTIQTALHISGSPVQPFHAFDTVSEKDTVSLLSKVLAGPADASSGRKPKLVVVLPNFDSSVVDNSVEWVRASVGKAVSGDESELLFGYMWSRIFGRGLSQGWFKALPYEIIPRGLGGLAAALKDIKAGKIRAKKMVGRIRDTPGLSQESGCL